MVKKVKSDVIRINSDLKKQLEIEAEKYNVTVKEMISILYSEHVKRTEEQELVNELTTLTKKIKHIDEQSFLIVHMLNAVGWSFPGKLQKVKHDDLSPILERAKLDLQTLKNEK